MPVHEGEDMTQIKKIELGNILVTTLCLAADPGRNDVFCLPCRPFFLLRYFIFFRNKGRGRVPPAPPLDLLLMSFFPSLWWQQVKSIPVLRS